MNLLGLFKRKQAPPPAPPAAAEQAGPCPHVVLSPRWDSVSDIGHEDKAVGYTCTACGASLTVEEGREIRSRRVQSAT